MMTLYENMTPNENIYLYCFKTLLISSIILGIMIILQKKLPLMKIYIFTVF